MSSIKENLRVVQDRIEEAAKRSGRLASVVQLVAVTKGVPVQQIQEAMEAGVYMFGENYVQEAMGKIEAIGKRLLWHMIGHLQRNKVRDAVRLFNMIETVDSHKLVEILDRRAEAENRAVEILVQVNLSGEESKFGINPDKILFLVEDIAKRKHLVCRGLMAIPPFFENEEESRPYFRRLRELRDTIESEGFVRAGQMDLSMGMSGDFEVAIEEGATIVRIGTAVFGPRKYSQ
jgi:hypothetical protein